MQFILLSALVATSAALGGLASPLSNRTEGDASLHKRFSSSRWTFYDVGLGACGETNVNSDYIVALNADQFGSGYPGPNCGKSITLKYGGKTATAKVMDRCPGCPYGGLDLSRGLFNYFASEDAGVLTGEWDFVDSSSGSSATTTKAETTSTAKPVTTSTKAAATTSRTPNATTRTATTKGAAATTSLRAATRAASVKATVSDSSTPTSSSVAHDSRSTTHAASTRSHTASATSTGDIASAVSGTASLPTSSAAVNTTDIDQMKGDLKLVGQILNHLGDFFDKYFDADNKDSN